MLKWTFRIVILFVLIIIISIIWIYLSIPDVAYLISNNPETTAIIQQRLHEAEEAGRKIRIRQKWVRFSTIPKLFKRTVRITEDANFYNHEGVDLTELKEALKKNWDQGEVVRGGSTISQQLAKNLYLSTSRSVFRKIREYFITREIENTLTKNRIFHLYLNIIEFGPGIFGVEAASGYYFGKSVANLSTEEMVRLTAIIPRPLKTRPNGSSKWLYWKCCWITKKLHLYKYIDTGMYRRLLAKFC